MRLSRNRVLAYTGVALGVGLWSAIVVYGVIAVFPVEQYLISYYLADYRFGFIRRGLAGELAGPVDGPYFFRHATTLRWLATISYLLGLAAVARMLVRNGWSERRLMLVLLLPALSFGLPFAAYSARPDLFGAAALVLLALGLSTRPRWAVAYCAGYGVLMTVLAFVHEALTLEFAFGAALAIVLLPQGLSAPQRRRCAAVAIIPGVIADAVIATFGRHDVGAQLCATVPHRMVPMMTSFRQVEQQLRTGRPATTDYHAWACRWYLTDYDRGWAEAVRVVAHKGVIGLTGSLVLGILGVLACVAAVQCLSGVPFTDLLAGLRGRWAWPAVGLALTLPLFATAFDWTRWLLVIGFNIVVVYLLFLHDRPELDQPPPRRTVLAFVLITVAFAVLPLGLVPGGTT